MDKVEVTSEHIKSIREKYDCHDLTDTEIFLSMLSCEENQQYPLFNISFPSFQSLLLHRRSMKVMEIHFKYNNQGLSILDKEINLTNPIEFKILKNKLSLKIIVTSSRVDNWWEIMGYVEYKQTFDFYELINEVDSQEIRSIEIGMGWKISSNNLVKEILKVHAREERLKFILDK